MSENKNIKSYNVTATWDSNTQTTHAETKSCHKVIVDPSGKFGAGPIEYMLAGLLGCEASVMSAISKLQKVEFESVSFNVDAWRNFPPRNDAKLQEVTIEYIFKSNNTQLELENLVKTTEKNCPIFQSLNKEIKINSIVKKI